jgi:hypothetical protein
MSYGRSENGSQESTFTLQIREATAPSRRSRTIAVKSWTSIKEIKDAIKQLVDVPVAQQRLFYRGAELPNSRLLHDVGVEASGSTLFFAVQRDQSQQRWSLEVYGSLEPPRSLRRIISQVRRGLEVGLAPSLSLEGTGGTYFFKGPRKHNLAAFKPQDEEPFAPNNPKGLAGLGGSDQISLRPGIRPGEACVREVAAYLCDRGHVLGVPATTLVEARHPAFSYKVAPKGEFAKLGSLQEFVEYDDVVSDISPSRLDRDQVHRVAILDIRMLNGDRHDANILVRKPKGSFSPQAMVLIPIDHGFVLPELLEIGWCDWCWLDWPQVKEPLQGELLKYVLELDTEKDALMLSEKLNLRESCLRIFKVVGSLLVEGTKAGLTLHDIANLIVRHDLDVPSVLEKVIARAGELAQAAMENSPHLLKRNGIHGMGHRAFHSTAALQEERDKPVSSIQAVVQSLRVQGGGGSVSGAERAGRETCEIAAACEYSESDDSDEDGALSPQGFWRESMADIDAKNCLRQRQWSEELSCLSTSPPERLPSEDEEQKEVGKPRGRPQRESPPSLMRWKRKPVPSIAHEVQQAADGDHDTTKLLRIAAALGGENNQGRKPIASPSMSIVRSNSYSGLRSTTLQSKSNGAGKNEGQKLSRLWTSGRQHKKEETKVWEREFMHFAELIVVELIRSKMDHR